MSWSCESKYAVRRARPLLGTIVEITGNGNFKNNLVPALEKAFAAVEFVQGLMSFHLKHSDVSILNRMAFRRSVRVHPFTHRVLQKALLLSEMTDGIFDCSIAPHLVRWGYLPSHENHSEIGNGTYKDIALLSHMRVKFKKKLQIDLGGIAKGFAVDMAVKVLKKHGVRSGMVNAGGDLRIFGKGKQPIYLRDPNNRVKFILLALAEEAAVATSAIYYSLKRSCGQWTSAIVHPKTGKPFLGLRSISVVAPTCMIADALTKAVILAGPDQKILKKFSASVVIISKKNKKLKVDAHGFKEN